MVSTREMVCALCLMMFSAGCGDDLSSPTRDDAGVRPGPGDGDGDGDADGGAPSVEACLAGASTPLDSPTEVLSFSADGMAVGFVRHLDPDSGGTSGTRPWLPQRFALARGGENLCEADAEKLTYTISHHNFADDFVAKVADVVYTLTLRQEEYGKPVVFEITAKKGDTVLWGPSDLTLVSCRELMSGDDCSAM